MWEEAGTLDLAPPIPPTPAPQGPPTAEHVIEQAHAFRESRAGSPVTNLKRLERMKAFFSWVTAQRWLEINPAEKLKAPLTDDAG